jgi:streptogramin lyase
VRKGLLISITCFCFAGCGHSAVPSPAGLDNAVGGTVRPLVVQTGQQPANWTQFVPSQGGAFTGIVVGPNNTLWYANPSADAIDRISMSGVVKQFPIGSPAYDVAVGPDKNFYVTSGDAIVQVTKSGTHKAFPLPDSSDFVEYENLVTGPDGNLWFGSGKYINRLTTAGAITEYPYPSGQTGNSIGGVAVGPDGDIWFTDEYTQKIGKIAPGNSQVTEYSVGSAACEPFDIIAGSDGNLWSNCNGAATDFIRMTTAGVATAFSDPWSAAESPNALATGPDHDIWWVNAAGNIGELDPMTQSITGYTANYANDDLYGLALGPDGNFWITSQQGHIDVYIRNVLTVTPSTLTFTGDGQMQSLTVKEPGTSFWSASSSDVKCATVAKGKNNKTFNVTSVGPGPCTVTIKDKIGNSFPVTVYVP